MAADFSLPLHLRSNPIFSAHYNVPSIFPLVIPRQPSLYTRFLKIQPTILNRSPATGLHIYPQSFFHRLSPQSFRRPTHETRIVNALPGDKGGDCTRARTSALATAALVVACVLGGLRLKGVARGMLGQPAMAGVVATYPVWLNMPVGARAVQALLDTSDDEAVTEEELNRVKRKFYQLTRGTKKIDYRELQEAARVLIKSGEADKMVEELERKFDAFRDEEEDQDAIEMGLILAEMQIYQGNFKEAINLLHSSFYNSEMMAKDIRPDLYRVAANLMSGNKKEALRNWDNLKFKEQFLYPPLAEPGDRQRIPSSISAFEAAVRKRKANILKARKSLKSWW